MCRYTGTAQATVVTKINLKKIKTNINNFVNLENKIKQDNKKKKRGINKEK